jgi:hypothetical protein
LKRRADGFPGNNNNKQIDKGEIHEKSQTRVIDETKDPQNALQIRRYNHIIDTRQKREHQT